MVAGILGLWVAQPSTDDAGWRGDAAGPHAVWVSPQPQTDATALGAELLALGAQVQLIDAGQGAWLMQIRSMPPARDAVNARLATWDTALDAQGRARLRVEPAAPAKR